MRAAPPRRAARPPGRPADPRRRLAAACPILPSIELEALPGLLADPDFPVQVAFRHDPDPASARLLESLGVAWTLDPSAPRCVRACGRPECRRTAAELRRIRELVDAETRRRDLPRIRERVERGVEAGCVTVREPLVRYGTPPRAEVKLCRTEGCVNLAGVGHARGPYAGLCEEACIPAERDYLRATNGGIPKVDEEKPVHDDRACRTPGCENRSNAKWSRGAFSGICWETCVPAMRVRMSEAAKRRGLEGAARTIDAPTPPPEPEPEPEPEDEPATLAELAAELEAADVALSAAGEAYERAVERFRAHPLVASTT